jgi:2'-5' RNA ligase
VTETARLFVAVIPPEPVIDLIAGFPRPEETGVRYTTADQWHITLRFLGNAVIDDARAALERVHTNAVTARFGLRVSRLGRAVVVLPVSGLDPVAAAVVEATADVGQAPQTQPFRGHLTLARLKHRSTCSLIGETIRASFRAREIHLVRSQLGRVGARYDVIATQELDPPA